jgi:hypothetical protein
MASRPGIVLTGKISSTIHERDSARSPSFFVDPIVEGEISSADISHFDENQFDLMDCRVKIQIEFPLPLMDQSFETGSPALSGRRS